MAIPLREGDKANFRTLKRACKSDDLALISTTRKSDGADVALVCAIGLDNEGNALISPLAVMIEGNPYELFNPPFPGVQNDEEPKSPPAGGEISVQREDESRDGQENL